MTEKELIEREELLEDILDALEDGDYEETEDLADEAIKAFPQEAFGYYYMAEALFFQVELDEAIYYYGLAVERAEDNPDYKARLALMHSKIGEEEKAKQIYKAVISQHDKHTASLVALGVYASNDGQAEEALEYLNRAVAAQADYEDAYRVRAIIHNTLGNYEDALQDLERALEQNPNDSQLWLQKIKLLDNVNLFAEAAQAFEDWIALAPTESSRYYAQAAYLTQLSHFEAAEAAYSKSIEYQQYGDYAALEAILGRGQARLNEQKLEGAIEDFDRVIQLEPKRKDAYIGLADARYKQGDLETALNYLDIGLSAVIDEPWALLNKKGQLLVKAEQHDAAQVVFEKMLAYDEDAQAEAYFSIGNLYHTKEDLENAFNNWKKASAIFHLEAEQAIDLYCSEFVERELRQKEVALLEDMQENFRENKQSPILQTLFGQYWTVDWRSTLANNAMLKDMPTEFEKPFKSTLLKICFVLTPEGLLMVNPGQDSVRLVYAIQKEDKQGVAVEGVPLNGTMKRVFTFSPKGNLFAMTGFGDEDADIEVYLQSSTASNLSSAIQQELRKLAASGLLTYMGDDFKLR
ncbi:MAG: tetratricopeptide repeat protein [Aureispira sp.]